VFLRHQLWGKAQQVLERCAPRLTSVHLRRQAWCALAELAQRRDDHGSAALCWKKAALADTDPQDP
jgi:HemY protein